MSKESLEQFMEKVGSDEEFKASIENQLDSDGNISVDTLIALGAENGCEFTFEDLQQTAELRDEELDGVSGGYFIKTGLKVSRQVKLHDYNWHTPSTSLLGNVSIDEYDPGPIYEYGDDYRKKPHGDKKQ